MYEIVLRKQPDKYLAKLGPKHRQMFQSVFQALKNNPYAIARRLHGRLEGLYKVRVHDFRIILLIQQAERRIHIVEIGPRGDIYK